MAPREERSDVCFGFTRSAGQSQASKIESEQARNVIEFRARLLLLGVNDLNGVRNTRGKAVGSLRQGLQRQFAAAIRKARLTDGCLQLNQGVSTS
jgi:hypothetical protein